MRFLTYLVEIVTSSINPLTYRKIVRHSALSALLYYFIFTTLHGIAISGVGLLWLNKQLGPGLSMAERFLPPVSIRMQGGRFSTNLPPPLTLGDREFAVLVNPSGTINDLAPYQTGLLVTETHAIFKKSAFETRMFDFSAVPDFTLTSSQVMDYLRNHRSMIGWFLFSIFALGIFPLVWLLFIPVILVFAIPTWIFAQIVRSRLGFGQTVSILFYSLTLPTLVTTYMTIRGQSVSGLFFLIYWVWSFIAIIAARSKPEISATG